MDEETRRQFIAEVWKRYVEVQNWAIANWPDKEHPLSSAEFVEGRKEILGLGLPPNLRPGYEPPQPALEPEQGGPQYQDVTPAPWP
ncbi:hypothetical protein [Pseudoduganella sp.]|uniref:hypothetical protein n=1 Tax=Pseudoduganella sp. TaxID=1880898 RepID=UPI0035B440B2